MGRFETLEFSRAFIHDLTDPAVRRRLGDALVEALRMLDGQIPSDLHVSRFDVSYIPSDLWPPGVAASDQFWQADIPGTAFSLFYAQRPDGDKVLLRCSRRPS